MYLNLLFPWVPSDDSWRRLMEALLAEGSPAALVFHARGLQQAPEQCLVITRAELAQAEKVVALNVEGHVETVLKP